MNYYKRHLGDYAKDAGHLNLAEHGAFTLLLDRYYSVERPITTNEAYRICRARCPDERDCVDAVLREFFRETADGWTNKRADEEIEAYQLKAERNREAGKKGGRPAKVETQTVATSNPDANPDETQTVSENNPSHKPLAISHKEQSPKGDPSPAKPATTACPHEQIIEVYHEALPTAPRVKAWTAARRQQLQARWREDPKRQSLDYWRRFFGHVSGSDFLTGNAAGRNGGPAFVADLEWLTKAGNFVKVIEGKYHESR